MLRNENGLLSGYVYVDIAGRDLGSYIEEAKQAVNRGLKLPAGYSISWSGQYEGIARVRQRLTLVLPLTLFLVMMLLYMNTRSAVKTLLIVLAVPFSAVGAIWLLYLLGYNMSIGVWVGLIALMGVDAETAVFMLLYLDIAYERATREGRLHSLKDLPTEISEQFEIAAVLAREDPHDALCSKNFGSIEELRKGARVGTSSLRREAQLKAIRPDLLVHPLRGNVDTRLRKLESGDYDAIILAVAGLRRLGRTELVRQIIPVEVMCPAAGQGALAIERVLDEIAWSLGVDPLDDATIACVSAWIGSLQDGGADGGS